MPDNPSTEDVPYREILTAIVKRFVRLVGAPAALIVARRIPQLSVDDEGNVLDYDKVNPVDSIKLLIEGYGAIFGDVAATLSRQAAQPIAEATNSSLLQEAGLLTPTMTTPIEILLVDDHILFREGLVSLLASQPDMRVVGQAGSVREAIAMARSLKPAIILMDISLPDGTGQQATRAILADQPTAKIMFLTVHEEDEQLFAAIRAGALGYLFKNTRAGELIKRLRFVANGEAGISPAIARRILDEFSRTLTQHPAETSDATELTPRELEIVAELASGATNREIAHKFVISENTVKNHVRSVLSKLHLHSRREIANYPRDHDLPIRPHNSID